MSLARPNFSTIYAALFSDVSTGLGNVPVAKYSILGSLSRALSRAVDSLYGYADATFLQAVPWTSTGARSDAWSALFGCFRLQPTSATGTATFVFNAAATLPSGSPFTGANAVVYYSTGSDVIATGAGVKTVALATLTTGSVTNLAAGATVTLSTPIANIVSAGTIVTMLGGSDPETDAALFARAQAARAEPPQCGGSQGDFTDWAEQSGATRAWVQTVPAQPGEVTVYCMWDLTNTATNGFGVGVGGCSQYDPRGIPASGNMATTADFLFPLRGITQFVEVVTPTPYPINLTVSNTNPLTTAAELAAVAALNARLLLIGTPLGQTLQQSDFALPLGSVLTSYDLVTPSSPVVVPLGSLAVLGTVTWS